MTTTQRHLLLLFALGLVLFFIGNSSIVITDPVESNYTLTASEMLASGDYMEQVLAAGMDMVSLGRPLIAEPDFVPKVLAGQEKAKCVSCCRCFVMPHMHPGVRCVLRRPRKNKS